MSRSDRNAMQRVQFARNAAFIGGLAHILAYVAQYLD